MLYKNDLMAVIYALLILNVGLNPKTIVSLENVFFDRIGTISYGLYMYHWPIIPLLILFLKAMGLFEIFTSFYMVPLVITVYGVTYLTAVISFKYLEAPFLKLKPSIKLKEENLPVDQTAAQTFSI